MPPSRRFVALLVSALLGTAGSAQVFFERDDIMKAVGWKPGGPVVHDLTAQKTYENPAWRAKMLRQFPAADADHDGRLTEAEAIGYHLHQVRRFTPQGGELEYLNGHASHWTDRAAMRDGQTLPVEVYLPDGPGPWPVVLVRTSRGRIDSALDYGNELVRSGYAVVGGDLTPEGDFVNADVLGRETPGKELSREDRAALNARRNRRNSAEDGADTIAWIARQSWCDGHVGMNGYSEAAVQTKNALSERPAALNVVVTAIGSLGGGGSPFAGIGAMVDWNGNYRPPGEGGWKPPALRSRAQSPRNLVAWEGGPPAVFYNDRTGWFDPAGRHSIEEWNALRPNGRSTLIMGIGGHGPIGAEARMPPAYGDCDLLLPEITGFEWLRGKDPKLARSRFYYFLMGDAINPAAPGNVWKVTDHWPVSDQAQSWYLDRGQTLTTNVLTTSNKTEFVYDPRHPTETLNGARTPPSQYGPRDQQRLDGRHDVLLFTSDPLDAPLELTGPSSVELYFSSDAPDTAFIVQLLDIYPDGYKWPIRENGLVTRYRSGEDKPEPLEPGKVYHLTIPLDTTAIVLDRGHRLGLQVMSSSYPSYPVHPNTWEAIDSYAQAKVAHQTIYYSEQYPSRIVLPVVAPGASRDYDPESEAR